MQITVNGETSEWPEQTSLRTVFDRLGLQGRRVAVAVNGDVVPRARHDGFAIRAHDRVEILTLAGGG